MSLVRRTSPFGDMLSLRQAMDRLFEESFVRPRSFFTWGEGNTLPLDIHATPDALVVEAALPGVRPEQVEITIEGTTLTINGSNEASQQVEEGGYLYQEIRRGSFSRTVTLPNDLKTDQAVASFQDGMLRLSIPRAEEAKPRRITITPTSEATAGEGAGSEGSAATAA